MFKARKRYVIPKTTPECERLRKIVIDGIEANILDTRNKEAARVALKRLRKKRCVKVLEYVMQACMLLQTKVYLFWCNHHEDLD